tara:strand:- start:504 stop:734 length:231 start_codon:yes stop_codon:yes gene_type:complete
LVVWILTQISISINDHKINECRSKLEVLYSYHPAKDSIIKGKGWNKEKGESLKEEPELVDYTCPKSMGSIESSFTQ